MESEPLHNMEKSKKSEQVSCSIWAELLWDAPPPSLTKPSHGQVWQIKLCRTTTNP